MGVGIIKALGFKARKKYYYEDNHVVPQMQISVNNKKHWVTLYGGAEGNDNCVFDVPPDEHWAEVEVDFASMTEEQFNQKYHPETATPDTSVPTVTEEEKKADEDAKKWQDGISNVNPDDLVIDMNDYFAKTDE